MDNTIFDQDLKPPLRKQRTLVNRVSIPCGEAHQSSKKLILGFLLRVEVDASRELTVAALSTGAASVRGAAEPSCLAKIGSASS